MNYAINEQNGNIIVVISPNMALAKQNLIYYPIMKICIERNSLKLSLTPSEVEAFAHDGLYKEKLQIGDDTLTYVIQRTAEAKISASFKNNIINLLVPEKIADEWTSTDKVSFDTIQNEEMHLVVEKDFKSADTVNENHANNFINPLVVESLEQQG